MTNLTVVMFTIALFANISGGGNMFYKLNALGVALPERSVEEIIELNAKGVITDSERDALLSIIISNATEEYIGDSVSGVIAKIQTDIMRDIYGERRK